jgi:phage-related protein
MLAGEAPCRLESKRTLAEELVDGAACGNALGIAQFGGTAPTAKPWKGLSPGVLEIVESHDGNAYRPVYTVRFENALYVLHAFQKKSPSGIRTAKRDVDLVAERLKAAKKDHEEHYGKAKH